MKHNNELKTIASFECDDERYSVIVQAYNAEYKATTTFDRESEREVKLGNTTDRNYIISTIERSSKKTIYKSTMDIPNSSYSIPRTIDSMAHMLAKNDIYVPTQKIIDAIIEDHKTFEKAQKDKNLTPSVSVGNVSCGYNPTRYNYNSPKP